MGQQQEGPGVGVGEGQGRNKAGIKLYLLGSFVILRGLVTRSNEAHKMYVHVCVKEVVGVRMECERIMHYTFNMNFLVSGTVQDAGKIQP